MLFIRKIYTITVILLYKLTLLLVLDKHRCNSDPYFEMYFFQITLSI